MPVASVDVFSTNLQLVPFTLIAVAKTCQYYWYLLAKSGHDYLNCSKCRLATPLPTCEDILNRRPEEAHSEQRTHSLANDASFIFY